jgi:response regulator RpfG family c-di-GMP phosphodiesterase
MGIILAAFFHDVTLESHAMARDNTRADLDSLSFLLSPKEAQVVLEHPTAVATLLRRFPALPPYTTVILEQHHEQPDGSGFPRRLNARQIHPMAALFIMSHDLVDFLSESTLATISTFVQQKRDFYLAGKFKSPFEQLVFLAAREAQAPNNPP